MKKIIFLILTIIVYNNFELKAQEKKRIYVTTGGEWIFSFGGNEQSNILRFSPVFNIQSFIHNDKTDRFGFMYGISMRNVGFIYDEPGTNVRKKFRTYNLGIPIAIKLGDLNKRFIYAGYEIEFPFNYKEKTFVNEKKEEKFNVWFSDRTDPVAHSFFVGLQFHSGLNLKFKYYINNFHNQDFVEIIDGNEVKPYENFENNVFYFSLNFSLFRGKKFIYKEEVEQYL
jgi:hypothetical protein